jgi:ElaA protein
MNTLSMSDPQQSATTGTPHFDWRWKAFDELSNVEVYEMLAARSAVFVIEQNCLYGDIDGLDRDAWHLLAYRSDAPGAERAGYLRVLLPDAEEPDIRIGRVLTTAGFRGVGLGRAMLECTLSHIAAQWRGTPIRLHAQAHLQAFYGAYGFEPISDVHEEDGIPHVWMRSA